MIPNIEKLINIVCQCYVCLNTMSPDDYDPEIENRSLELAIAMRSSMLVIFGKPQDHNKEQIDRMIQNMSSYAENSQFFNIKDEEVRILLSSDDMEINALRTLFYCLSRSLLDYENEDEHLNLNLIDWDYEKDLYTKKFKNKSNKDDKNEDKDEDSTPPNETGKW